MILLDCGNSQVKGRYCEGDDLRASFACAYRVDWISHLRQWLDGLDATRVVFCSVLDRQRQAQLDACLAERFGKAVNRFGSEPSALGITNAYREPSRLGADRWMALLGAAALVNTDCMVIDAGSAITLDLLCADGRHLGGAILPGFNTSEERFRRIFSHIDFDAPAIGSTQQPGCSTEEAIQIDYGQHTIDRLQTLVNHWIPLLDDDPAVLLAGGDAARVQTLLGRQARIVPDLVFRGLQRLPQRRLPQQRLPQR